MLDPTGLIAGHFECRSWDQTEPVLTDLLSLQISQNALGQRTATHPNSGWSLIVHEEGPGAPDKPHNNHYGFRVAHKHEINNAYVFLSDRKEQYGLSRISKPSSTHFAYSVYLKEPGGNDVEIEWYDIEAAKEGRQNAAAQWQDELPETTSVKRGYMPQSMSHGTLGCVDKEQANRFYEQVLGLSIVGGGRVSTYIGHPAGPWYIVVIPGRKRHTLTRNNRFVLQAPTPDSVEEAHIALGKNGKSLGISALDDLAIRDQHATFLFADPDLNWWEFTSEDVRG